MSGWRRWEHDRAGTSPPPSGRARIGTSRPLEAASRSQSTYLSFLNELLEAELQERQRRNVEVRMKLAHLPYRRTLQEFDFSFQPGMDERLIRELAGLTFIGRQENVLFFGPPGVGKIKSKFVCKFPQLERADYIIRVTFDTGFG